MKRTNLGIIFSIFLIVFFISFLIIPVSVQAQDFFSIWTSNPKESFAKLAQIKSFQIPPNIKQLLMAFGIPEQLAGNWLLIAFFVAFPIWFFTIILGSLIQDILGDFVSKFKEAGIAYFTGLIIVIMLMMMGIIGGFMLWLYLSAASLAIYMAFFVFIGGLVNKFAENLTKYKNVKFEIFILLLVIGLAYFFGWLTTWYGWILTFGFYLVVLILGGWFLGIRIKTESITKETKETVRGLTEASKALKEIKNKILPKFERDLALALVTLRNTTSPEFKELERIFTEANMEEDFRKLVRAANRDNRGIVLQQAIRELENKLRI